jgi:C4-dicarboxylate-specific signal transduction histidine kinase
VVIIPRDTPGILVDRTQIQQVLVNLIINALQAMDQAGSPVRKVTISVEPAEDSTLAFSVRDSGPGFEPDHVKRLFEHFFTTKEGAWVSA